MLILPSGRLGGFGSREESPLEQLLVSVGTHIEDSTAGPGLGGLLRACPCPEKQSS